MPSVFRRPAVALFLGAWLVYNLNLRPISSGDTAPAALIPLTVWLEGTTTLDRYAAWLDGRYPEGAYFLVQKAGHYYSSYPLTQPLLLLPLYSPLVLAPGLRTWPVERLILLARILEKLAASLVAACAVALFYCLARRLTRSRQAMWLALVFAFGTSIWSISSQALWQHGMGQLLIVASLLCVDRFLAGGGGRLAWVGAGLCAALSAAVRPTNVLFVAACCAVLLWKPRWKLLGSYLLFGAAIGGALAAHNLAVFGQLSGWYGSSADGNLLGGLAGLLLSPGRGLFVYSPVFLFLGPALYLWLRPAAGPGRRVAAAAALFAMAHVLVHATWPVWWAGHCFGPRYLSEALPCLVLLLVPVLGWLERAKPAKLAFIVLAAFSVFVQFVGAFCHPLGQWNTKPVPVVQRPERLWDWRDNPIRRDLSAGPDLRGYRPLAALLAGGLDGLSRELEKGGLHLQ